MAIKTAFSSLACPAWDLHGMIEAAKIMGYDGIELRGLSGEFHLPDAPELADDPAGIRRKVEEAGVQICCLGSSASFESPKAGVIAENQRQLVETIELAAKLGCPFVRIFLGNMVGSERRGTLGRIAMNLVNAAKAAARNGVCIVVENGGDFLGSDDLWFVVDAVGHPSMRACLNPLNALMKREYPTLSVPRLGRRTGIFRVVDGVFQDGIFSGYAVPGQGDVELAKAVELLRGVCFDGWLSFEWPKVIADLPEPDVVLPAVLKFLHEQLAIEQPILTAYKGDKQKPNLNAPPSYVPREAPAAT